MRVLTRRIAGATASLTGLLVLSGAVAPAAAAQAPGNEDNITICHRTNSNGNPYIEITTDSSGQNGGTDHFFEHEGPLWTPELKAQKIEWGDVIPPSDAHPDGSQAYQELIAGGVTFEDFVANGCEAPDAPEVPTFDVTLDKVLGANAPVDDPTFTFTVTCESGTVPASPVTIKASDDPVVVAEAVAEDDTCTITETEDAGASAVTYAVTGGSAESSGNPVTFTVEAATSVVATNDFPAPAITPVVQGNTLTQVPVPAPVAPVVEQTEVAGVQVTRELARTGTTDGAVAMLGLTLLVLGAAATAYGRRPVEF